MKDKIKEIRKLKEMSIPEFAAAIGVSKQTVYEWEAGRSNPTRNRIEDIAEKLNVPVSFFLEKDEKPYKEDFYSGFTNNIQASLYQLKGYVIGKFGQDEWKNMQQFFPNFNVVYLNISGVSS